MISRFFYVFVLIFLLVSGYFGWRTYHYFFDKDAPLIELMGLEQQAYYAGDISCCVRGSDTFKIADLSIWLDDKPLVTKFKINAAQCEYTFSIPTKTLAQGQHILKVELVNGTYERKSSTKHYTFFVDNIPLQASLIKSECEHKVFQGRTLHLQFQLNKDVKQAMVHTLSKSFPCFPETKGSLIYECFIPIACEEVPNEYVLTIEIVDKVGSVSTLESKFQVIVFPFKKQNLKVGNEKYKSEQTLGLPEHQLEVDLVECLSKSPAQKLWQGVFYPPIEIKSISTEYGTVRTTQEKGRYMHKAVDVLDTPRSVVWATQDGIVALVERYAHSGNTVVIDHGFGIFSLFFHLEKVADIKVGQSIKRGQPIGTLGMTGYASGYHLHWEMRIDNIHVDPMQWIKPNFF